ncbi:hypothetical protein [Mangrovimonas spongiae]|uniref:Calx-beta domain-containing protein n=1 Tax=Mangrovimonas spongiae TaxID=2494697 RepID=A0A428K6M2_9FLAO|nr:hypothetical protein [Mangrovimonas spongiae]RSK42075.1 hypothetical protein EJA19_04115 [Mangrovimonas spongiae]
MKNLKYLYTSLLSLVLVFSCDYEKAKIDTEDPGSVNNKSTATITSSVSGDVNEGQTIDFLVEFDKPTAYNVDLVAVLKSGTADEDDVQLGGSRISAYSTSTTVSVTISADDLYEEDETATIHIEPASPASSYYVHPDSNLNAGTFTIKNVASNELDLVFDWDQTFTYSGSEFTLCQIAYDNDFLLFNGADGSFIDYLAATADCPEVAHVDISSLADGDYLIIQNIWDDGGLQPTGLDFLIPVTVEYSRGGSTLSGSYTQADANAYSSTHGSDPDGLDLTYVMSFNITNGVVTLFDDTTGTEIGSGRAAAPNSNISLNNLHGYEGALRK